MLWLGRRRRAQLFESGGCFRYEDIFLEKALADKLFQLLLEPPVMDGLVPLIDVVGVVLFCSEKSGAILDESWTPDPGLVLEVLKTSLMESPSGVNCSIGL